MKGLTTKFRAIALLNRVIARPTESMTPTEARAAMRASTRRPVRIMGARAPLASVRDDHIAGVKVRRYLPPDPQPGVIVFFHGGGWVVGDVDSHDTMASVFASTTKRELISVDYRLAPEHPYPAAIDDAVAVTQTFAGQRIVVMGDSAGGNLAAVVANHGSVRLAAQVLLYPITDCAEERPSYETYRSGYLLSRDTMRYFRAQYVPEVGRRVEPGCSPLRATTVGDAPAYVLLAACDVLRDEGLAYAQRLARDGVEVEVDEVPGTLHGFVSLIGLVEARAAVQRITTWLEPRWA